MARPEQKVPQPILQHQRGSEGPMSTEPSPTSMKRSEDRAWMCEEEEPGRGRGPVSPWDPQPPFMAALSGCLEVLPASSLSPSCWGQRGFLPRGYSGFSLPLL